MTQQILIDAGYSEETRVALIEDGKLLDFDFETAQRKQKRGNIYLGKIVRVEPALQAAFVDYGEDRHGFIAFSDIHPDYFRIPIDDRKSLIAQVRDAQDPDDDDAPDDDIRDDGPTEEEENKAPNGDRKHYRSRRATNDFLSRYGIQEVMQTNQVILVQVIREERGNKGAALTTYISLAGRYCVLMPNSLSRDGVSRKISKPKDRHRLRDILKGFDVPTGMSVIVRTAGIERTKTEIRRDYDFLMKTWTEIRERTLNSFAPALVFEGGNIVTRFIRDLYTRDVDQIIVHGSEIIYKDVRKLMSRLIPSHVRRIKVHEGSQSLFAAKGVEPQIDQLFELQVQLRSGGYLIIEETEALVSIDVNSGRAISRRNVEDTALETNMEAASEIARQLRLRDLSGLIVVDFIDMIVERHRHKIENHFIHCLGRDQARIQVGKISNFGLLEMSRQRMRPSLLEGAFESCSQCGGRGVMRSIASTITRHMRSIEAYLQQHQGKELTVTVAPGISGALLNTKRAQILAIEDIHDLRITIVEDSDVLTDVCRLSVDGIAYTESTNLTGPLPVKTPRRGRPSAASTEESPRRRRDLSDASLDRSRSSGRSNGRDGDDDPPPRRSSDGRRSDLRRADGRRGEGRGGQERRSQASTSQSRPTQGRLGEGRPEGRRRMSESDRRGRPRRRRGGRAASSRAQANLAPKSQAAAQATAPRKRSWLSKLLGKPS
ncbi:MAG: Rne/Rng family ribonuclease [Pseudomonadota bacterium]